MIGSQHHAQELWMAEEGIWHIFFCLFFHIRRKVKLKPFLIKTCIHSIKGAAVSPDYMVDFTCKGA